MASLRDESVVVDLGDGRVWRPGLSREDREIVKLLVADWKLDEIPEGDPRRTETRHRLIATLQAEGFERMQAMRLVIGACRELRREGTIA